MTKGLITFIFCHNCFAFVLVGHCITATSNKKVCVWESTTPKKWKEDDCQVIYTSHVTIL